MSIISVIIELSRKRDGFIKNIFARWFDPMLKEHELKGRLTGASWTFVTVAVLGILFPRDIVVLSLLFLHVGDPVAAMVGMKFGTIKIFGKSLEGTLAGMAACILVSLPFSSFSLSTRLLASAWAMLMEVLPWPIDDNVVIPVMGATMLWVIG